MYTGIVQGLEKILDVRQATVLAPLWFQIHTTFFTMSSSVQV
jgi:hypothetical protein